MQFLRRPAAQILQAPGAFGLRTLKAFRANQGLLLAGAVAYYALLSIVQLLILTVIALSHVVEQGALLQTVGRYLEWLVPGQSKAVVAELANFLAHRAVLGWVLLVTLVSGGLLAQVLHVVDKLPGTRPVQFHPWRKIQLGLVRSTPQHG